MRGREGKGGVCTCSIMLCHSHTLVYIFIKYLFQVTVGDNIEQSLGLIAYEEDASLPLQVIIPAVVVPVAFIILCFLVSMIGIICVSRKAMRKNQKQFSNYIFKMENEMAEKYRQGTLCISHITISF